MLLALPSWAVDIQRARWLTKALNALPGLQAILCRLHQVTYVVHFNTVVLEFVYPKGESLSERLGSSKHMSENGARVLCRDLLQVVTDMRQTPLRLWGILPSATVYLDKRGEVCSLLPIGCVLSFRGAKSCAMSMVERAGSKCLPPELDRAIFLTDQDLVEDVEACFAADNYAVAALVLEALVRKRPEDMRQKAVTALLPEASVDLLHKVLYEDWAWRLTGNDALAHPWLSCLNTVRSTISTI